MQNDILKYHRVKEIIPDILKHDKITAASIEVNSILLGTEQGYVHLLGFDGQLVKTIKAHDRAVNGVSVNNSGHTIAR